MKLAAPPIVIQEFINNLDIDQCKQLVVPAYTNDGGLELPKAVLLAKAALSSLEKSLLQGHSNDPQWFVCSKCKIYSTSI